MLEKGSTHINISNVRDPFNIHNSNDGNNPNNDHESRHGYNGEFIVFRRVFHEVPQFILYVLPSISHSNNDDENQSNQADQCLRYTLKYTISHDLRLM